MPTQFCNLPYISIIYIESYVCLVWKLFPLFCRYLCSMFVVLLVTFIMPVIYSLLIAVVLVSSFCVYLTCWVATYAYSWINMYRGWTNNENTRQCRTGLFVLAALKEHIFYYSFVCLCCVVPVSVHYILCLVTVCKKVLQNGRLLRFSDRTDFWCTLTGAYVTKMATISCIQISNYQGYDDIHKSWEDIIS